MTTAIDFSALKPEPSEDGIPNFRASGELGDTSQATESPRVERKGRLSGWRSAPSAPRNKKTREAVPKLPASAKKQIEKLYTLIGGFVRPFDEVIGDTIMEQAPQCAEAVFELAQQNDQFRAALNGLMTSSLTGAVIFAHLPILLAVTRKSSNPKVKAYSVAGYMGLKMADKIDVPNLWEETEEDAA